MKIRIFLISLIGSLLMLAGSTYVIIDQIGKAKSIDINPLQETLYAENSSIMASLLDAIDIERLETVSLPESWAEIMLLDSASLEILNSTAPESRGNKIHSHKLLLDQADQLMAALSAETPQKISSNQYLIAIKPLGAGQVLLAFKDKSWEHNIIAKQDDLISSAIRHMNMSLKIFIGAGLLGSLLIALIISFSVSRHYMRSMNAFNDLSLGKLDTPAPKLPQKEQMTFIRIKTTLNLALERLGNR